MACPSRDNLDFKVELEVKYDDGGRPIVVNSQFDPPVLDVNDKDLEIIEWDIEDENTGSCMGYATLKKPIFETRENEKYGYGIGLEVKLTSVGEDRILSLDRDKGIRIRNAGKKSRRTKKHRGKTLKKRRNPKRL